VEEFIAQAVTELHEREEWLATHQDEIRAKIEEGWAEAERGEFCSIEDVKQEMAAMKLEWLAEHKRA
jgi:predicted transcriptional regulator